MVCGTREGGWSGHDKQTDGEIEVCWKRASVIRAEWKTQGMPVLSRSRSGCVVRLGGLSVLSLGRERKGCQRVRSQSETALAATDAPTNRCPRTCFYPRLNMKFRLIVVRVAYPTSLGIPRIINQGRFLWAAIWSARVCESAEGA